MAMKLLEKDIYVKQDGLITLREQLDKVKSINVDIYQKLQVGFLHFCLYKNNKISLAFLYLYLYYIFLRRF